MSISLSAFKRFLKVTKTKEKYDRPIEEILKWKEKSNKKLDLTLTPEKGSVVKTISIMKREVQIVHPKAGKTDRALLYIHGGGFVSEISAIEKKAALKFSQRSGRDLWLPRYPLCTEVSVFEVYSMLLETYREMLKFYAPENIAVIGFSAGAIAGLVMFEYNNTLEKPLPIPKILIASSPVCKPVTEKERALIKKKADRDLMIPVSFINTLFPAMCHGEKLPGYMTEITTGDLSNMPFTHIYYGGDEIASASAGTLAEAFKRCRSKCQVHIGKGLFHCYPAIDMFPETREAFEEIVGYLS